MHNNFKISVLIPAYNSPHHVDNLLKSLLSANGIEKIDEILIGNDASNKYTTSLISTFSLKSKKLHTVNREKNIGYLRNINDLYKRSVGDIVVLLNSDTLVPCNWIERIVECFAKNPTVAVATPLSTNASFVTVHPAAGQSWKDVDLIASSMQPSYPDIPSAIGFCLAIRRSALDRSNLLNTNYKNGYWEDTELHYHIVERGFRSVCVDNLLVYHAQGSSSFSLSHDLTELNEQNRAIFMAAHGKKYLSAVHQYEKNYPLKQLKQYQSIQTFISRIKEIDFLFVLPAICRESGGIYVVLQLLENLLLRGHRASIYCYGHIDWSYVAELGFSYPFTTTDEIMKVTPHILNVVATSYDSFSHSLFIRNRFDANLVYLVQGPESAFSNGQGLCVVADDYKRADKVVAVSPFLQRYICSLSQVESSLIRMGPQKHLFYSDDSGKRDTMAIAVAVRQGHLKGTGPALHNAKLAKDAGFRLHFFGDDLPGPLKSLGKHHGRMGHKEIAKLMRSVGYYLDCSYMEGLGLLPLEAAFCGAIPILLKHNGLSHVLRNDENCFVLPSDFENDNFFKELHTTAQSSGHLPIRQSAISVSEDVNESLAHDDFANLFKMKANGFSEVGPVYKTSSANPVLQALLASTSWRVTRPVRQIGSLLKGKRYSAIVTPASPEEQNALIVSILSSSSWSLALPIRGIGLLVRRWKKHSLR